MMVNAVISFGGVSSGWIGVHAMLAQVDVVRIVSCEKQSTLLESNIVANNHAMLKCGVIEI